VHREPGAAKPRAVVERAVEADDRGDALGLEVGVVVFRDVGAVAVQDAGDGLGPRERHELARHDPRQVAVFDGLVVVVLLHVERRPVAAPVVQQARRARPGDAVQDVAHGEVEGGRPRRRVAERHKRFERRERRVRVGGRPPQHLHREQAHQDGRVGVLVGVGTGGQAQGLVAGRGELSEGAEEREREEERGGGEQGGERRTANGAFCVWGALAPPPASLAYFFHLAPADTRVDVVQTGENGRWSPREAVRGGAGGCRHPPNFAPQGCVGAPPLLSPRIPPPPTPPPLKHANNIVHTSSWRVRRIPIERRRCVSLTCSLGRRGAPVAPWPPPRPPLTSRSSAVRAQKRYVLPRLSGPKSA